MKRHIAWGLGVLLSVSMSAAWAANSVGDNPVNQLYFKKAAKYPGNWYMEVGGAYSLQWQKFERAGGQAAFSRDSERQGTGLAYAEVGYALDPNYATPWRFSLSVLYRPDRSVTVSPISNGSDNSAQMKWGSTQFMANVYYDFHSKDQNSILNQLNMTPYVGVGLGLAHNRGRFNEFVTSSGQAVNGGEGSTTKNQFAWDVVVGSSSKILSQLSGNVFVRFSDLGKNRFVDAAGSEQANGTSWYNLDIGLGLRYDII